MGIIEWVFVATALSSFSMGFWFLYLWERWNE